MPRLSPDGRRLAVVASGDIWILDLTEPSAQPTRLTFDPGPDFFPVWTPDGRHVVFGSWRGGGFSNLYVQAVDGGTAERLIESPHMQLPTSITPDGSAVIFHNFTIDLERVGLAPPHPVEKLVDTPLEERNADVSPDGRWLAYEGEAVNRPGFLEVFVRPFADPGSGLWQVSTAGGMHPVWGKHGGELFYREPDGAVMAVRVTSDGAGWSSARPVRLFRGPYLTRLGSLGREYDVSPDGSRFLMLKHATADPSLPPPHIAVVQHLDRELERLLP